MKTGVGLLSLMVVAGLLAGCVVQPLEEQEVQPYPEEESVPETAEPPVCGPYEGASTTCDPDELQCRVKATLEDCKAATELNMMETQSLMSQRATAVQLGTGIMQKINQSLETIAKNI